MLKNALMMFFVVSKGFVGRKKAVNLTKQFQVKLNNSPYKDRAPSAEIAEGRLSRD